MKKMKKKIGKILLSLTTVFAMALTILPTNLSAAGTPSATISDVTVSGYTNVNIPRLTTPYSATLTLQNAQFMFLGDQDITAYCEGVPSGITVNLRTTNGNFTTGTLTFYGTPTEISNETIKITLPGDQDLSILYSNEDITVTVNPNAKWNIEKNNLDDAKPLAETAIANITATNDTEAIDILDTVNNSISTVSDVSAAWKAEPTIIAATKNAVGSIQGTIILTYKSLTTEVVVNKTIAKLPKTDKEKIDEAKPLAETAISQMLVTNTTTSKNILDAVTTGILSVEGVTASWKEEPTITPATKENEGSITGTIVLTCGSESAEVNVNKVIDKLTDTDKEKVDKAKPLAENFLSTIVGNNQITASSILSGVTNSISSIEGVSASWKSGSPIITPATKNAVGSITGKIKLTCGIESVEVAVNITIDKLPKTDKDKLEEAKPLAESAIKALAVTNSTTASHILSIVNTDISSVNDVTASWKVSPTMTPATKNSSGSIIGTIVLRCGNESVEVTVNKIIEKLSSSEKPSITVGNSGTNHEINNGKNMTFTCSSKLEDLTGVYVDGKLLDSSNYTLKSGSTILTLKTSYLDTLSAGKHTLKFQYKDNVSAEIDFTITAKTGEIPIEPNLPQTDDKSNTLLYISLITLSLCAVGIGFKKKKV